ncbi:MAG TPA: MOSC domain-containing protein [Longimicrobiales bacterium]|nr:MOSC domain-containing protein [Longimicrobiales bacterium]
MAGRVEAIWLKRAVRGPMDPADEVSLVAGKGIDGDANFGRSKRQVTIIEREAFDEVRRSLPDAEPSMRRANFMVSGLRLEGTRDQVLSLGGVRVHIHGETRPCERMDAQCQGLTAALEPAWRGGVYGVVLDDGPVRVGEPATLEVIERAEGPFAVEESAV